MTPENPSIPDWVRRERLGDLQWIRENLFVFWPLAKDTFEENGRGAFVVDTTVQPVEGKGHPFGYFTQDIIEDYFGEDARRIIKGYDPQNEFIIVLMKTEERSSTYRVKPIEPENPHLHRR